MQVFSTSTGKSVGDRVSGFIVNEISDNVNRRPLKKAVINPDGSSLNYRDFHRAIHSIGNELRQAGVAPGDRVVVMLSQDCLLPASALAIIQLGAVYVPVDPDWPAERVEHILNDVEPAVILAHTSQQDLKFNKAWQLIQLDSSRFLDSQFAVNASRGAYPYKDDEPCYIFYTSGTTGFPKGVELSYRNLQHYIYSAAQTYRFSDRDTHLAVARFTFSISFFDLILPFYCGGTLQLSHRESLMNPEKLSDLIKEVTCFHMGPALLTSLVSFARDNALTFPNVRHVSSGGDLVPVELLAACRNVFPSSELWVIYGSTELACMAFTWRVPSVGHLSQTFVGKTFGGNSYVLVDDQLQDVKKGELGEVLVSGPGVALGYINRPDLTAEQFVTINGKRFYRTGDVGVLDDSGFLRLAGRIDFQIKINGIRIEAQEVEHWIKKYAGVEHAFVVGANNSRNEKKLIAFYTGVKDANITSKILDFVRQHLPAYMVPSQLIALDQIPVNHNGKVDRKKMIQMAEAELTGDSAALAVDDITTNAVVNLWRDCGVNAKSLDAQFFESGGDSLAAAALTYKLGKHFQLDVDIDHVYDYPVLADQVSLINNFAEIQNNRAPSNLVKPLNSPKPNSQNIYLLPGLGGHTVSFQNFGELFSSNWNLYGLLYPIYAKEKHHDFQAVAKRLIEDILRAQPAGPYFIAGYSLGGFICLEIVRQLREQGYEAYLLIMEVRIFELAPEKNFIRRLPYTLYGKALGIYDKVFKKRGNYLFKNLIHHNKSSDEEKEFVPPDFQHVVDVSREQMDRYTLSACDVTSVLIKARDGAWWDQFRDWPVDYGWSRYTNLLGTVLSPGDHLGMASDTVNRPGLAQAIEAAIAMLREQKSQ